MSHHQSDDLHPNLKFQRLFLYPNARKEMVVKKAQGHFPNKPIVPGVIIVEGMAQTAGIVVSYKLREYSEKSVLFMSVNKAKFRKPIRPDEKVLFEVKFINSVKDVYKFEGSCYKGDVKVSEAEFSAMITYK